MWGLVGRNSKEDLMDRETKRRIADYFESWELAEFLRLPVAELIEAFEGEVEDALEDINELMGINEDD